MSRPCGSIRAISRHTIILESALQKQGKLNEAAASYEQALRLKPDFAEAHHNLGDVLRLQGKLDEAVAF